MSRILLLALSLYAGGSETASALVVKHGHHPLLSRPVMASSLRHRVDHHYRLHRPTSRQQQQLASSLLSATSNTDNASETSSSTRDTTRRKMALQLMEENAMPLMDDNLQQQQLDESTDGTENDEDPLGLSNYDQDDRTPIELEFLNLMNTFLMYSEQDIRSLTTTSSRYLHYQQQQQSESNTNSNKNKRTNHPHQRSKEEGIRYRTLYSGVQAASLEPEVLRSFTVLFEDFLPIRLAGRRIYAHLSNVMEEVREERKGEIARALEVCVSGSGSVSPSSSWDGDVVEYARGVWDVIMDEGLLLEHSSDSGVDIEQSKEGGVISLSQLVRLGVDQVLIEDGFVSDVAELELIVRQNVLEEDVDTDNNYKQKKEHDVQGSMTFPVFMKVLYQCTVQKQLLDENDIRKILQKMEQKALNQRTGGLDTNEDTSTLIAAKAVLSGSTTSCTKRQKYSDRFDEYVSTFKIWERKFMGNDDDDDDAESAFAAVDSSSAMGRKHSRRWEILRGCFFGARNAKVKAALKIVYMDYTALRLAGDLIFKLTSKVANQ